MPMIRKNENFRMTMYADTKLMLTLIAEHERRTKAGVLDTLIREKYRALTGENKSVQRDRIAQSAEREAVPA